MIILNFMLCRDLGGLQQVFLDYDKVLTNLNHKVINVVSKDAEILKYKNLNSEYIEIPNLGTWCLLGRLFIRYIILKYEPDLVIAHGGRAVKFVKFWDLNIPIIGPTHGYTYRHLKYCSHLIAHTKDLKDYYVKNGFLENNIRIIPNMINLEDVQYCKPKYTKNSKITLGIITRLVDNKKVSYFIRVVSILKKQGYDICGVIAGDGEEKSNLKLLSQELNIEKDILFLGWVDNKKSFFDHIDIFCYTSIEEAFGVVILEAMKYSKPIISIASLGVSHILRDGIDGILTEIDRKEEGLVEATKKLINEPELAEKYSYSSFVRLKQIYDSGVVAKQLENFCSSII